MRPLSGRLRTDFCSTTSPTLASVVRSTASAPVTSTTAVREETVRLISSVSGSPTSSVTVRVCGAKPWACTPRVYSPGSSPLS